MKNVQLVVLGLLLILMMVREIISKRMDNAFLDDDGEGYVKASMQGTALTMGCSLLIMVEAAILTLSD